MSLDFTIEHKCKCCFVTDSESFNYTNNLVPMWKKALVYDALYMSDGKSAIDVVDALIEGRGRMEEDKRGYSTLNPDNGWGSYESGLDFLGRIIRACHEKPHYIIRIGK